MIEVLVAIAFLTLALTPLILAAIGGRNTSNQARNNLITADLAQEGLEVIHAIRDDNWFASTLLSPVPFDTNLADGTYEVQWNSTIPQTNQNRFIKVDANGIYQYVSGTDTMFKRTITILHVVGGAGIIELKVTSQVSWTDRGQPRSISVENHLFNWN